MKTEKITLRINEITRPYSLDDGTVHSAKLVKVAENITNLYIDNQFNSQIAKSIDDINFNLDVTEYVKSPGHSITWSLSNNDFVVWEIRTENGMEYKMEVNIDMQKKEREIHANFSFGNRVVLGDYDFKMYVIKLFDELYEKWKRTYLK